MEGTIEIGDKVKCKVSGLEGPVTSKTTYLYGCDRIGIMYGFSKEDGKPQEIVIDDMQGVLLEKQIVKRESRSKEILINLGDKVEDKVSGFTGIAIGRCDFMYGCTRIGVMPRVDKDGKQIDTAWFDEPQLEIKKEKVVDTGSRKTGGPAPSIATRNVEASRK